ncbi:MAG: MerR family transcriptional regulator [Alphaproteobacteria bacterium]|nr:MerR family transcriptional regulator [Alphaproteobacteria bacterium]
MTDAQGDKSGKSPEAYRTIGEVSEMLGVAQHVLRFWESRFSQIKPVKRAGNRRYYRPDDIALIRRIRALLHDEGYSIRGVQKLLKSSGVKGLVDGADAPAATPASNAPTAPAGAAPAPAGNQDELRGVLGELREIRDLLR